MLLVVEVPDANQQGKTLVIWHPTLDGSFSSFHVSCTKTILDKQLFRVTFGLHLHCHIHWPSCVLITKWQMGMAMGNVCD